MATILEELTERMKRYGMARDRETDKEVRTVTITDDDAVICFYALEYLALAGDPHGNAADRG